MKTMESNFKLFGGRFGWLGFYLGIVLLLQYANAHENRTNPTKNVNLGPIQMWRSAYFCLQYQGASQQVCKWKDVITPIGNLNVSSQEIEEYCKPGQCADHIRTNVLTCIYLVMRNLNIAVFKNGASIQLLNDTINTGCSTNTSIILGDKIDKKRSSGSTKVYQKTYTTVAVTGLLVHSPGQRCKTVEAEDGRSREETGSRFIGLGGVDGTPVVLTKNRVREKSRETGVLGHLWPLFSRRH
ncbi:hypothetical protein CsatB_030309 [Cannabis sativa]